MNVKRFQNKVAESRIALPATAVYALCVCALGGLFSAGMWLQIVLLALSAYLIFQLNNVNALIRIFSRMVSCSYLVLTVMSFFLFDDIANGVTAFLLIAFFHFFFSIYQDGTAVGRMFYAFAVLGVMSVVFVQTLYFVPIVWIMLFANIMAGNARMIIASLMGLTLPYWFLGAYSLMIGDLTIVPAHLATLIEFEPIAAWQTIDLGRIVTIAFVVILAFTGIIHFRLNNYKDKIRTRMLFEIFTIMILCILLFMILQPNHADRLLSMLLVCTAPMIAHYIALTNTKITNISFYIILLVTLGLTVCNIWSVF